MSNRGCTGISKVDIPSGVHLQSAPNLVDFLDATAKKCPLKKYKEKKEKTSHAEYIQKTVKVPVKLCPWQALRQHVRTCEDETSLGLCFYIEIVEGNTETLASRLVRQISER